MISAPPRYKINARRGNNVTHVAYAQEWNEALGHMEAHDGFRCEGEKITYEIWESTGWGLRRTESRGSAA